MITTITLIVSMWIAGHPQPQQLERSPMADIAECLNKVAKVLEINGEVKLPDGREFPYQLSAACMLVREPANPA